MVPSHQSVTAAHCPSGAAHLIRKDHQAVVGLPSNGPSHTLRRVPHGVEGQEVILPDLELVPQVLQTGLAGRGQREGREGGVTVRKSFVGYDPYCEKSLSGMAHIVRNLFRVRSGPLKVNILQ